MKLSKRQIEILLRLIDSQESITTKVLASSFQVSVRTIKYDLDHIRFWGKKQKIELYTQRNKGVWFELTDFQKLTLKNELLEVEQFDVYPNKKSRVPYIIVALLMVDKMTTISYLAELLEVSNNTIISDLDQLEVLIKRFQVTLKRQSGQGLSLVGEEEELRILMEYCFQEELTGYDIYKVINQLLDPNQKQELTISLGKYTKFYSLYQQVIYLMAENMNPLMNQEFNYTELLSFSFRLAISVFRLKLNRALSTSKILKKAEEQSENRDFPFLLMVTVFDFYDLPLLQREYDYISSNLANEGIQEDVLQLTLKVIREVSRDFNFPFEEDAQLLTNLFAHLSLRLGKKHSFVNEYNPFVEEILNSHEELFGAIRSVGIKEFANLPFLLTDSFISYLTLHFLVSLERQKKKIIRVIYVCSTGLGVTKLLQQKVAEEVLNVEIVNFASVLNATELIEQEQPDLVISIFPMDSLACQVIKVNPIPTKEDIALIKRTVQNLLMNESKEVCHLKKQPVKPILSETMEDFSRELIVTGYTVYEKLLEIFGSKLNQEYKEAFLLHVLLMVHRITFDTQYQLEGNVDNHILISHTEKLLEVEQLFSENDLAVNKAELTALLNYVMHE